MKLIDSILDRMNPISLDEMNHIRLMDRIDSKFVASVAQLPALLERMIPYYRVQTINEKRIASYCTQYLDTPDLKMFVMHQNGKLNRQKVRIRSYTDSDISFLEVKSKNNKGRTSKERIRVPLSHLFSIRDLNGKEQFLDEKSLFESSSLEPALANNFDRITFVNIQKTERVTVDFNLSFLNYRTGNEKTLNDLMVLELKQDGWQRSEFRKILFRLRIKPFSFSKYCIGTMLTNPEVKYNRFKYKWILIDKLIH